jgi:hypothetical protein
MQVWLGPDEIPIKSQTSSGRVLGKSDPVLVKSRQGRRQISVKSRVSLGRVPSKSRIGPDRIPSKWTNPG